MKVPGQGDQGICKGIGIKACSKIILHFHQCMVRHYLGVVTWWLVDYSKESWIVFVRMTFYFFAMIGLYK
jgi:hypothetical protein